MAICLFSIIAFYIAALVAVHVRSPNTVSLEERYFRYAGILFFLLLLVAIDQWRGSLARVIPIVIVGMFAIYGLISYVNGVRELMQGSHHDRGERYVNASRIACGSRVSPFRDGSA